MTAAHFKRVFRLRSNQRKADDVVSIVRVDAGEGGRTILLPHSRGLAYVVAPASGSHLTIEAKDFHVETLDLASSLWLRLRLALMFKKKKYLRFDGFWIFSIGPKPERRRFASFNQHMSNIGAALDGDLISAHPEIIEGWTMEDSPARRARRPNGPTATAVVAHVYYEETWGEIAGALARVTVPFDLVVTTVPGRESLIGSIRRDFPDADIVVMENRGRDVRPFLVLLEQGRFDRYRVVCKIHGKKSSDGGRKSYLGSLWRRRLLFDLLAAPGLAASVEKSFDSDPTIGMIGPRAFRLPSKSYPEDLSWSVNKARVMELAARMGVPAERFRLDFFGGTMFWVRPEALAPLRRLKLSEAFPEEQGLLDGGLEHAVERLFGAAAVAAGYRLEECDGFAVAEAAGGSPR